MASRIFVVGFRDEAALVKKIARAMKAAFRFADATRYRAGEMSVLGPAKAPRHAMIVTTITEDPATLFRAGLLAEALRDSGAHGVDLVAPWIAYGRQDRAARRGEAAAGNVVGKFLSIIFDRVVTLDAHSPAFVKSFRGKLVNVIPTPDARHATFSLIVAPDQGATDRAKRAAKQLGAPFVVVEKKREKGKIVASRLDAREKDIRGATVLLVDDIADSGETLAHAACLLQTAGASSVSATVTHSVDLARLRRRCRGMFRRIDSAYDHATGRIDDAAINALTAQARRA